MTTLRRLLDRLADRERRVKYHDAKYRKFKKQGKKVRADYQRQRVKSNRRAVQKLDRLIKARIAKGKPSPNFSYAEFDCHNGEKVPAHAKAGLDALCTDVLEPLRAKYGPCTVLSGYRPPAYNASIGGATNSYHLYTEGRPPAADVTFGKGSPSDWAATAAENGADGIGTYEGSNFVHVDQRGYTSRWSG